MVCMPFLYYCQGSGESNNKQSAKKITYEMLLHFSFFWEEA